MPYSSGEITQFWAILAPDCGASRAYGAATPDALILRALAPLRGELDATLCRNDRPAALQLVYRALVPIAEALAAWRGDRPACGQVRVHALLVELEPLPLASRADGTVLEQGTAISVMYRNCMMDAGEVGWFAQQLSEQWRLRWPGAWFTVTAQAAWTNSAKTGAGL